ncbi:type IV secretory system conjugative DNA transfer family protein [Bradyrhizobium pachyrhizi]|uniref:type IV secretory system conjugative DNA transfer family protein n=1 Tax=Bradyrhizobium pachyrhizi TaxID=280333 RepID=UPI00067C7AAF|nr:type IV secretory system conjugative DNA transfer family protein [Bradyrhizobium pachyrhizi]
MGTHRSPDQPASVLHRLVGIRDIEPPITDQEFELYQRFVSHLRWAPRDIAESTAYPKAVNRRTRLAVRKFVSDPALPGLIQVLERAKAQSLADDQRRKQEMQAAEARAEQRRQQAKLAAIETFHDNQLNELRFDLSQFQHLIGQASIKEATLRIAQDSQSELTKGKRALNVNLASRGEGSGAVIFGALANLENHLRDSSQARGVAAGMARFVIRRTLVSMTDGERATLRMADVLEAVGRLTPDDHLRIAVPIAWNGGECAYDFDQGTEFRERAAMLEVLKQLMAASLGTSAGAREYLNQAVRGALDEHRGLPPDQRQVVERYLFSGNRWMSEAEGQRALARDDLSASALRIGGFPGGDGELLYDLRESLITIAPSGSGKSQAHVLRNLLHMEGPALVLDIKGEMSAASRGWREREVGKTYVFSPREPETSFHYNPLDDIGTDPEQAWEDARTVADLMFKPKARSKDDEYFEGRARDILTTALLDVALSQKGAKRTMESVLKLLYTSDDEDILAWCKRLDRRKSTQLSLQASALRGMPVKQRESLLDSARRHVEIWQSPSILKVTGATTFDAASLRNENATVYLKVTLEDVDRYASVLRVLVGQSLLKLYRVAPESDALVVTFFLDELPRLGRLDVIEQSLDVGRGYGVRLWLFCQNLGQLQTAYPNAQGMMSNCAIRCFMNPDEDAARWLSENLGTRHGLLDGNRKALVEAHQLTGPEFASQVVVFSRGQLPAHLDKKPAYADPICQERIAAPFEPVTEAARVADPVADAPEAAQEETEPEMAAPVESQTIVTDDAQSQPEPPAAVGDAVDWDAVRTSMPASLRSAGAPMGHWLLEGNRAIVASLGLLSLIGGAMMALVLQAGELRTLRAEKASLAEAVTAGENSKRQLLFEKAAAMDIARSAEMTRDRTLNQMDSYRQLLSTEQQNHAAARERLAGIQRELEAEKSRAGARAAAAPQAPLTAAPPPSQPAPVAQAAPIAPLPSPPAAPAAQSTAPATPWPAQTPSVPTGNPAQLAPSQQLTDCDRLAGNPNDPRRLGTGAKYPELRRNAGAAVEACDAALSAAPNEQRFVYQKARALYAANDTRARPMFDELMNAGYPSAFDNAAQYLMREGRMKDAEALLRRGVQLQDPDAMVSLADSIRGGSMQARTPGEELVLYRMAAKLGHQGAKTYVDEMQGGSNLFDQAGGQLLRSLGR